jgi:hypothetical protein
MEFEVLILLGKQLVVADGLDTLLYLLQIQPC